MIKKIQKNLSKNMLSYTFLVIIGGFWGKRNVYVYCPGDCCSFPSANFDGISALQKLCKTVFFNLMTVKKLKFNCNYCN